GSDVCSSDLHHIEEFLGALVAFAVVRQRVLVEVQRLGRRRGGHQVPAGAAVGDPVQRGELAGQVVGLVVGGAHGADQADTLGHRRQGGQQGERFQSGAAGGERQLLQAGTTVAGGGGHRVGDEDGVERGRFGGAGHSHIFLKVVVGMGRHIRAAPGGDVVAGGQDEGVQ